MSSKRSKAARARAAAAAKRARTEESELVAPAEFERPPPATDVISTLPLELLALIFARAPFRARLRAIGLVSRRFRTAALRSVDTLALVRGDIVAPAVLPAALALFPALTDLALSTHCPLLTLPSSLQRLSLRGGLEVLMRTEEAGVRTVLSATFPALTALSLSTCHGVRAHSRRLPQNPLVAFVARHAPHLRALTLQCTLSALAAQVVAAPFPALEELDISAELRAPRLEALLRSAPRLRETALRQSDELLALPPALLTSLTRLEPGAYVSPELGALLRRLPSLRHVGADAETLAAFGLRAFAYHVHLAHEPFRALEHCSNVVDLTISPMCRGPFVPPRLPHLRLLALGHVWLPRHRWKPAAALRVLAALVGACPTLRYVSVTLASEPTAREAARLADAVRNAMQRGVRTFIVDGCDASALRPLVPFVAHGWIEASLGHGPRDRSSSDSDLDSDSDSDSDSDLDSDSAGTH